MSTVPSSVEELLGWHEEVMVGYGCTGVRLSCQRQERACVQQKQVTCCRIAGARCECGTGSV